MKKVLSILAILCGIAVSAQGITGAWKGELAAGGAKLNLVFNIQKSGNGYTATMDSPDQGASNIPFKTATFSDNKLVLTIPEAQIEYTGTLQDGRITGTYQQGKAKWPLNLVPGTIVQKRPQHPKPPYPYLEEEVTFKNQIDNVQLAGTLTLPGKDSKYPVAILISGSGQQDRNSTIMGHQPFHVIADHLTRVGIAVLRFDDRGVGKSTGDPSQATSANFAEDVRAAVKYLQGRKEIIKEQIGMIGHSEGGVIAPMVASGTKDIGFMVLLAGPGVPGDELLIAQTEALARAANASAEDIKSMTVLNRKIYDVAKEQTGSELENTLKKIFDEEYNKLPANARPAKEDFDETIKQQIATVNTPWFQYFVKYDPASALAGVKCPVLVLNGGKDLQVPAEQNTNAIRTNLEKAGNDRVRVRIFPELNHLFQEAKTGAVEEYGEIEQTFSPVALDMIGSWILTQFN
jgi:pimeloyl-ACP methyl ester carboxylesterase